ncbi:MAG: (2Fe-2S) ferredoxin domain-containing protein [Clostridiaceae bacterium]|nr:(2Fe-2S) ferredoxin domain-containing protein [Clostridiaceae bacterium]
MEIVICVGSSCHLRGSRDVARILEKLIRHHQLDHQIELKGSFCMGECVKNGVCVQVEGKKYTLVPADTERFFQENVLKDLDL